MAPVVDVEPGQLDAAEERLAATLRSFGDVLVAFSGGADSAYLAWFAHTTLGPHHASAVTAVSASLAPGELEHCAGLADAWGLHWLTVTTDELDDPSYRRNDADRCARCKTALMEALTPLVDDGGGAVVVLGVNVDDLGDHRPGQAAAADRGARFPLVEAGFTKAMVRAASRRADLATWDRPAAACLASRIPYGTAVTVPLLDRVGRAEAALRRLGFDDLRVRHYDDTARIEVPLDRLGDLVEHRSDVVAVVRAVGYRYVTVDLEGLRSGNLNAALAGAGSGASASDDGMNGVH
ncbi:MAG: ATP-dependent sacrificial sulfur transferase LarE [Acidimicrobiia bacterium]|nr:ATP-dependent sacrificial sulfur transferase LarE [Acidimicrobiia bacterium]